MRVLVLRPQPAAARTAKKLVALGHEAALLPLSKAEHDIEAVRAALGQPHAAIAITSAEVARLFSRIADSLVPHLQTSLFAVGQASAEAARDAGFHSVLTAGGDGKGLADLIAAHYRDARLPETPILYLAGNPRTPNFETRLREVGIPFRTVESYRMVPLVPSRAETEAALSRTDAVLLYSRESARAFFSLLPGATGHLQSTRLLCMSPNVAAAVPPAFAARTAIAAAPDEESLLALL